MKLSDIESKQLLPRFASDISWLTNAFDSIVKPICERVKSIDAPLTLESIQACTDEELEALYNQYGVAQYYPNLSRETRDLMLFEMCKIYRYLGTPKAIEILCKYIFDNNPIVVKVLDNIAFNDDGVLIDESLLDVFDVNVESQSAFLDEYANARILANIIRFSRNSQFLRYIYYDFPGDFNLSISPINGNVVASYYENDAICEPVELNHYTFIVADATTGQIVSGFSNELVYGEIEGIVLQSPRLVYGVDITVPTIQFWFTDEGRNYDEDKELLSRSILRDENGNRIKSPGSTIYDDVPILAYMHINGDMLESTDGTIEYYGSGSLRTLTSLNGSAVGESVWSVFAERIFTLSFANTQLPDITITLPADETGYKGTSITLPTMSGEYESGGKTWKPSAWDIGAFGSSYSLTADVVAHLVFEEVQQYQEITLYMASGSKAAQTGITSAFTGNVNSSYCHQLYIDEACTIPWTGYDYSNEYVSGRYVDGVWTPRAFQKVSDLPSSTGSPSHVAIVLLDTGSLWLASNASSTLTTTLNSIIVRIYPKDQRYYAAYFNQTDICENYSLSNGSTRTGVQRPGSTQFIQTPHQFPTITLQKVLGSAGNEITGNLSVNQGADSTRFTLNNNTGATISIRVAIYTLEYPTFYHWLESDGTNVLTSSGVAYPLMNLGGEIIEIDNNYDYFPIGLIQYNGNWSTSTYNYLNNSTMGAFKSAHPTWLCFKQSYGTNTLNIACVWYYRKPKS